MSKKPPCSISSKSRKTPRIANFERTLIFQVQTKIVSLFEIQAALLHDAREAAALNLPASQSALAALQIALQINSQQLADNIVSFIPLKQVSSLFTLIIFSI